MFHDALVPFAERRIIKMDKVVLYGCGVYLKETFRRLSQEKEVVAIIDSDDKKQGLSFMGYTIMSPNDLRDIIYDKICITSFMYYTQIKEYLINKLDIPLEKIMYIGEIDNKAFDIFMKKFLCEKRKIEEQNKMLRQMVIDDKLKKFVDNNKLVKIEKESKEKDEISDYWTSHTVHDDWFIDKEESIKSCEERYKMYPFFREFMEMDRIHEKEVILDYGCGPGHDIVCFGSNCKVKQIIGMDVSESALNNTQFRLALHNISNARLILIDEGKVRIPLGDNSVDFINCGGVLMHTSNPQEIIQEFYRVLKKNSSEKSKLNIMVYNRDSIWYHLYAAYYLRFIDQTMFVGKKNISEMNVNEIFTMSTDGIDCPRVLCWEHNEFSDMIKKAGFKKVEYKGGYVSRIEIEMVREYLDKAINDSRLEDEHKKFLKKVRLDKNGYPRINDVLCCIGGSYLCYL